MQSVQDRAALHALLYICMKDVFGKESHHNCISQYLHGKQRLRLIGSNL